MNYPRAISVSSRLRAQIRFKLLLTFLLYPFVYGPYFFLQFRHFFAPTELQPGVIDQWVPFDARFAWIYLSVSLLMPIGPVLMNTRGQLYRYAAGIVLISVLADLVFVFHPTYCPRPDPAGSGHLYQSLVAIDNPFHGFPSLHAAFALYSGLCATRMLRLFNGRFYLDAAIWIWVMLILYSTLATKQHTFLDIAAGTVLGTAAYFAVFYAAPVLKQKALPPVVQSNPPTTQPIA